MSRYNTCVVHGNVDCAECYPDLRRRNNARVEAYGGSGLIAHANATRRMELDRSEARLRAVCSAVLADADLLLSRAPPFDGTGRRTEAVEAIHDMVAAGIDPRAVFRMAGAFSPDELRIVVREHFRRRESLTFGKFPPRSIGDA